MGKSLNIAVAALFLLSSVLLSGCAGSRPPNYYILHSLDEPGQEALKSGPNTDLSIGVGPVRVPEYLDRPQMATRATSSSLQLAEFDKWAEPLDKNLTRVLAENLAILLSTDRIGIYPWPKSMQVQYQVTVDITQLEYVPEGKVVLAARWNLLEDHGEKMLAVKRSSFSIPVTSPGHEGIASAESRAVEALSREIASSIKSLQ